MWIWDPLPLHPNLCYVTEMLRGLSGFPGAERCLRWKRGLRQPARPVPPRPSQPRLCPNQRPRPVPHPRQARSSERRAGTLSPITIHTCADTRRHRQRTEGAAANARRWEVGRAMVCPKEKGHTSVQTTRHSQQGPHSISFNPPAAL